MASSEYTGIGGSRAHSLSDICIFDTLCRPDSVQVSLSVGRLLFVRLYILDQPGCASSSLRDISGTTGASSSGSCTVLKQQAGRQRFIQPHRFTTPVLMTSCLVAIVVCYGETTNRALLSFSFQRVDELERRRE